MGKAKRDGNTPEQPTATGRLVLTPEQRSAFQRMVAEKFEQAARLNKAAKNIDRVLAIRDGLIPPPWAKKLVKPDRTKSKARKKVNTEPARKEGPKEARINLIACRFWPPDGKPPASVDDPQIVKKVGDAYQKQHGHTVHRTTILRSRAIRRLERR
jgi:hypothetical protein